MGSLLNLVMILSTSILTLSIVGLASILRSSSKNPPAQEHMEPSCNWMGYVAVTSDEEEIKRLGRRDILIAWRAQSLT
ncbi:Phospholipase A1-Igamma3 chloroplastic [Bienertia sinuspersici]